MAEQGTHKPLVGGSNPPSATNSTPLDELAAALGSGARALDIADDARLVLAVSGGPDSMALLHGAARLVETGARAWQLTVAHLDHELRAESADDASFVTHAADALELPWELRRTDVAALARAEGRSTEDAGREARYRFLEEVAGDGALIATAHTADDAAETVLLNLLRGSGLSGARGIPARRGRIVRPLLLERRATLRSLLDAAGVAYRLDPRTTILPTCATACVASCCRYSRICGRARSTASASSRDWRQMTTRCSTSWRPRSWRGERRPMAESTGTTRRVPRSVAGSSASRSAPRPPAPSGWRR